MKCKLTPQLSSDDWKVFCSRVHFSPADLPYIHGIFDNEEFLLKMLKSICERKGITYETDNVISVKKRKEKEYDKLADMIRTNMDIEMVYKIIGL